MSTEPTSQPHSLSDIAAEIWRPVKEWPKYEISSIGRVRRAGRILKPQLWRNDRYFRFHAVDGNRGKKLTISREMAKAFIEPFDGVVVRHLNGNSLDNRLENLAWGTVQDNENDKRLHGRVTFGIKHPLHKLTDEAVRDIRGSTLTRSQLAKKHGVCVRAIYDARTRRTWPHI